MKIFDILQNKIFENCNVECYSFWIKKRVLVYEYGANMQGKIKLGLLPEEEEGALIYNTEKSLLYKECGNGFNAIFIYHHKDKNYFNIILVLSQEYINNQGINRLSKSIVLCKEKISFPQLKWKAIIATESSIADTEKKILQTLTDELLLTKYKNYIGRDIETFLKE